MTAAIKRKIAAVTQSANHANAVRISNKLFIGIELYKKLAQKSML